MNTPEPIKINRSFNASTERLWSVLTDNEELRQWYFDFQGNFKAEVGHEFDWYAGPEGGKQWHHRGRMLEVIPQKKLSYAWEFPGYAGKAKLTWLLTPKSVDKTQLTILFEFLEPFLEDELNRENFVEGWNMFLNELLPKYLKM